MALVLILVVGQDPDVLSTRCSVLQSAGYAVRSAASVAEAIGLFRYGDFDLMLLCHSMQVADRDRLIQFIRSTGSHIPICTVDSASQEFRAGLADRTLSSRPEDLIKELGTVLAAASRSAAQVGCR